MFLPSERDLNDGLFQPFWERAERRKKYPQVIATISGNQLMLSQLIYRLRFVLSKVAFRIHVYKFL